MYGALPKTERSFDFDFVGPQTGYEYKGTFTVKCVLTIGQKHAMELEKSRLMADQRNPTNGLINISVALAEIRSRLIDAPAWWKDSKAGAELIDEEVIYDLFNKCLDMEDQWRAEIQAKAQEASSKNAQTVSPKKLTVIESIQQLAHAHSRDKSESGTLLFMQSWWSRKYCRPMKDPLLMNYTAEELAYEYFDHIERENAAIDQQEKEDDKIEEAKYDEAIKWAEEEEAREKSKLTPTNVPPSASPEDLAWAEEQMRLEKEIHGDDFGKDIVEEFE